MALTFDDGPYHFTNELLEILSKNKARATFFVTGMNGAKGPINEPSTGQPDTLRRMVAEGHQIAAHSWSHEDINSITNEQKHDQIIKNEIALADVFGFFPTYYRPPYTGCGMDCIAELGDYGYHVVSLVVDAAFDSRGTARELITFLLQANYNLDTNDWRDGVDQAKQNYAAGVDGSDPHSAGIITLAHDIHATTVHDLTKFMIDKARQSGYELVTVGECLGDPPGNWYRDAKTGKPLGKGGLQSALGKGSVSEKAKSKSSGTSLTAAPTQPGSSAHSAPGKGKPGGEAKSGKGIGEYNDFIFDSDFSQMASTLPTGGHMGLYTIAAIFVGVVAML